ncbi:hypothetical protein M3Y99_00051300 [Aphelenchoides fujianensis]|nr:hypothetical protein M3Y99_00051300 [Aphelenchoides fujianensis]
MLRGSKNTRWETRTGYVDENGKPIPAKNAAGSECTDMQGKVRKEGEEYERPQHHHFVYTCKNGLEEVKFCVGSNRTKNARIEVGQNLDVDGFWHKCTSHENGSVIYTQENSCRDLGGKEIHIGDEFSVANLRFACGDGTYTVVGCAYKDGSGQEQKLNEGETRQEGKLTHTCEKNGDSVQYQAKGDGGCQRKGKEYKEGDTFQENHLKYACKGGQIDITGCYTKDDQELAIGKDVAEGGVTRRARAAETPATRRLWTPGPDEVPALGHGLKSPGIASFSIASNGKPVTISLDKLMKGQQ